MQQCHFRRGSKARVPLANAFGCPTLPSKDLTTEPRAEPAVQAGREGAYEFRNFGPSDWALTRIDRWTGGVEVVEVIPVAPEAELHDR